MTGMGARMGGSSVVKEGGGEVLTFAFTSLFCLIFSLKKNVRVSISTSLFEDEKESLKSVFANISVIVPITCIHSSLRCKKKNWIPVPFRTASSHSTETLVTVGRFRFTANRIVAFS